MKKISKLEKITAAYISSLVPFVIGMLYSIKTENRDMFIMSTISYLAILSLPIVSYLKIYLDDKYRNRNIDKKI
jgi:hypothetical protein